MMWRCGNHPIRVKELDGTLSGGGTSGPASIELLNFRTFIITIPRLAPGYVPW